MWAIRSLKHVNQKSINTLALILLAFSGCTSYEHQDAPTEIESSEIELLVLGTVQDGGSPHLGCTKPCCSKGYDPSKKVVSLGVIDHTDSTCYMLEASPDFVSQYMEVLNLSKASKLGGIFLTHAHIGHYTGLMYLGKESLNTSGVHVAAMPKMKHFLETNGPWSQLVEMNNIQLYPLSEDTPMHLKKFLRIRPILVPHRDEFSETVGYLITGPAKKVLFIPDIDKWDKWEQDIVRMVNQVDYAFIDATFYSGEEINNRDIREIPHPFVIETMALFDGQPAKERNKIHFIHLNHTNPLLDTSSQAYETVVDKGYHVARFHQRIQL